MKRLLYATTQLPWPLDNGQKIATISDLKTLAPRFEIDVISYLDPVNQARLEESLETLDALLPGVHFQPPVIHPILIRRKLEKASVFVGGLLNGIPYMVNKYRSQSYCRQAQGLLESKVYEYLYVESVQPPLLLRQLPQELTSPLKKIYRGHDIIYETLGTLNRSMRLGLMKAATWVDYDISRRYEHWIWRAVDAILPVTRRMGRQIVQEMPEAAPKVFQLPVTVDLLSERPTHQGTGRVLYIGTVHYPPNLLGMKWFLKEVWPQVLASAPQANLEIIGRGGDLLGEIPAGVTVRNYVEDLSQVYNDADVFIVPLFAGSGIRLKIMDALNHRLPVVSTRTGYAGLEVEEGRDLLAADDAPTFARAVCSLLNDPVLRDRIAEQGYRFLEQNHSAARAGRVVDEFVSFIERQQPGQALSL